jgi:hypothetical protein
MTTTNEPGAMAEIREIRRKLSDSLNKMTPEEQIAHIKKGAEELEKEFGFKLKRQNKETATHV